MNDLTEIESFSTKSIKPLDTPEEFNPKNFTFFKKPTYYDISEMKLEGLKKYAEIIQWGRKCPVKFCERFFGIEFLDYQKYVFMMSWITPQVVWCMSRSAGKTTLGSPFLMAKTLLIPKFEGYILSSNGSQSIGMMKKIESIAKKEIASFTGLTDVFLNELVKTSNSEGFIHNPASYSYKMWSGSNLSTVNSNFDGSRGRRSRLNFYDEASYVSEDMFAATLPFVAQNSDFALGGDIDITLIPPNFPNQVVYASSAGSTEDVFYKRYKEFSMHMMAGDKRYFVADVDCDIILNATYNGKIYPVPLLTQEKIDSEMKMNPMKATREYRNKFDTDLGEGQIVKKSQVIKNSFVRPPVLYNDTGKRMVSIAFDPARKKDNSAVTIGEFIYDEHRGWTMDIINCVNLVDIQTKKRIPLETPKQVKRLKKLVLDYNGEQVGDYTNIRHFLIDAGAGGGGGTAYTDLLFEDWYEEGHEGDSSYLHRGMIDPEYSDEYVKKYPNAAPILKVLEPTKVKVPAFLALIEMIEQGLITFTADYDYHGYLTMIDENSTEDDVKEKIYKLTLDEEESLKQIDALKEELTHMYRYKSTNQKDRFDLAPGCENLIGDDRVYTLALLALDLFELRRENITNKKREKNYDITKMVGVSKRPQKWGFYNN